MRTLLCSILLLTLPWRALAQAPPATGDANDFPWQPSAPDVFVDLAYPSSALEARVAGHVIVGFRTDARGAVTHAEALAGHETLAEAAVTNLRQWRLSPDVARGAVVYRFEIEEGRCNDEGQSLFELAEPNLVIVTACSGPGREAAIARPAPSARAESWGQLVYPALALEAAIGGVVVLDLALDATGSVLRVERLSDAFMLGEAVVQHALTLKFNRKSGRRALIVYEFDLSGARCDCPGRRRLAPSGDYFQLKGVPPTTTTVPR